jgi:hypothetical protein
MCYREDHSSQGVIHLEIHQVLFQNYLLPQTGMDAL